MKTERQNTINWDFPERQNFQELQEVHESNKNLTFMDELQN